MLSLAEAVGPSIVVFETHADMLSGWNPDPHTGTGAKLAAIARRHRFLIFEDRKFADIGFTVQLQYAGGDYKILEWAHVINAHIIPGPDIVRALKETAKTWKDSGKSRAVEEFVSESRVAYIAEPPSERAALLLAQMSSSGNFLDATYTKNCVAIGRENRDFVMGFIALQPQNSEPDDSFIIMTPGCSLTPEESLDGSEFVPSVNDALGQQYVSPRELILRGCDVIIVGTGICNAKDPRAKAEQYRKVAWEASEERKRSQEFEPLSESRV